jgi:hypothetical protein
MQFVGVGAIDRPTALALVKTAAVHGDGQARSGANRQTALGQQRPATPVPTHICLTLSHAGMYKQLHQLCVAVRELSHTGKVPEHDPAERGSPQMASFCMDILA